MVFYRKTVNFAYKTEIKKTGKKISHKGTKAPSKNKKHYAVKGGVVSDF